MSLEMAQKVIVPQKKVMSRSFLNRGTLIVILLTGFSIFADFSVRAGNKVWGGGCGSFYVLHTNFIDCSQEKSLR
jgi:hypothetical protein